MALRAIVAFVVLPGLVAYIVPLSLVSVSRCATIVHSWALGLVIAGTIGLLACVLTFFLAGRGTLAPWSPPTHLVQTGPYRWSRNPMYVCVIVITVGWGLAFAAAAVVVYALGIAVLLHVRVVYGEEVRLAHVFGTEWETYSRRVRRWL